MPCDVDGVAHPATPLTFVKDGAPVPDVTVSYQFGFVFGNQDGVQFTVEMPAPSGEDTYGSVALRPASPEKNMKGFLIFVADTQGAAGVAKIMTSSGGTPEKADAATLQNIWWYQSSNVGGTLTFKFILGVDNQMYPLDSTQAWDFAFASGSGRVFSSWTKHSTSGITAQAQTLQRCDISAAAGAESSSSDGGGGMGIGIIVAIILGVLLCCAVVGGAVFYRRKRSKAIDVDYTLFFGNMNDPCFDDFDEAMNQKTANEMSASVSGPPEPDCGILL